MGSHAPVAGLVLAAGDGSRLGRPKALLRVADEPLVTRAVSTLVDGGCAPVHVVVGADASAVRRLLADARMNALPVTNPEWDSGMASSLRCGLRSLPTDCSAVVVSLVDQPELSSDAVRAVIRAHRWEDASVAIAAYEDRRGHPVLVGREHWDAVANSATGDAGARVFLRSRPEVVVPVPISGRVCPCDIDTPQDLRRAEERLVGGRSASGGPEDSEDSAVGLLPDGVKEPDDRPDDGSGPADVL